MMILSIVLLGLFAVAETGLGSDIKTRPGFHYVQRPRLGHFKDEPFTDLYKTYAVAFVLPENRRDRDDDDHRNYAPAGEECVLFFRGFIMDEYKLRDLDAMIMMDACLGYLYESKFHEEDKQANAMIRDGLDALIEDTKLRAIYDGTSVDKEEVYTVKGQDCIGDTLWDAIKLKRQFSDVDCNNHWIQLFNDFAECQTNLAVNLREEDSYAKMLYELVKQRGQICFDAEIHLVNEATRAKYANNPLYNFFKVTAPSTWSPFKRQQKARMWPSEISTLFEAVQGADKEINLREVHAILKGTLEKKGSFEPRFLNNLALAADSNIRPKKGNDAHAADPSGYKRYERMVDNMCKFFRSSDNKQYYDYATAYARLVKMLNYQDIFGISQEYFLDNILNACDESGPMYLAVFSCNVMTFTQAQFKRHPLGNGPLKYEVKFLADTSKMIRWPIAGFY